MATNSKIIDQKLLDSGIKGRDKLLTPKSAEQELGISTSKIYWWVKNKRFKFYKPSKEILFWRSDLLEWLEENAVIDEKELYDEIEI